MHFILFLQKLYVNVKVKTNLSLYKSLQIASVKLRIQNKPPSPFLSLTLLLS